MVRIAERKEIMNHNSPLASSTPAETPISSSSFARHSTARFRGAIVGIAIGSALVGGVGIASAQNAPTTNPTATTSPKTSGKPNNDAAQRGADRSARLTTVLAPLVANGTINQSQADTVVATLVAAQPAGGDRHGGFGGRGGRGGRDGAGGRGEFNSHAPVLAKALGISETELDTALKSGKTIATIAKEKGIAVETVISALTADEKSEHPDRTDAELTARITDLVNGVRPTRPSLPAAPATSQPTTAA